MAWLVAASLTFYATWKLSDLPILLGLIAANFILGACIAKAEGDARRRWLVGALAFNLLCSAISNMRHSSPTISRNCSAGRWPGDRTVNLPLGISFIAFQKIAYLVDVYQKKIKPAGIFDFSVFASFFPQLVAGPIVHYREIGPQLLREEKNPPIAERLSIGATIFAIGLFKKIVLADSISPFANSIFNAAADGATLTFFEAWLGTLCYALADLFRFFRLLRHGDRDRAHVRNQIAGQFLLALRARNVIEFWRRWHITLSRFLRDYLYIPLGGNRRGRARHFVNLMITMTLGGIVARRVMEFRSVGRLARRLSRHQSRLADDLAAPENAARRRGMSWFGGTLTFIVVTIAWVPFRANTIATTISIWKSMAGLNGISLPKAWAVYGAHVPWLTELGLRFDGAHSGNLFAAYQLMPVLLAGLAIVFFAPNTTQFMAHYRPVLDFNGLVGPRDALGAAMAPDIVLGIVHGGAFDRRHSDAAAILRFHLLSVLRTGRCAPSHGIRRLPGAVTRRSPSPGAAAMLVLLFRLRGRRIVDRHGCVPAPNWRRLDSHQMLLRHQLNKLRAESACRGVRHFAQQHAVAGLT